MYYIMAGVCRGASQCYKCDSRHDSDCEAIGKYLVPCSGYCFVSDCFRNIYWILFVIHLGYIYIIINSAKGSIEDTSYYRRASANSSEAVAVY